MTHKQLQQYYKRINIQSSRSPSLQLLTELQEKHTATIPFENINPFLGLPVTIDFDSLFGKIVLNGRGGYCFEQNGLFLEVLKKIGFYARGLTGRVIGNTPHFPLRTHMLILVKISKNFYVTDVGFGGLIPTHPLLLKSGIIQPTSLESYRILADKKENYILQIYIKKMWRSLYIFDLQEQSVADYTVANWYTSTNPESRFTTNLIVSIAGKNLRNTLHNNLFSTYSYHKGIVKQELRTLREIQKVLTENFKINLDKVSGIEKRLKVLIG